MQHAQEEDAEEQQQMMPANYNMIGVNYQEMMAANNFQNDDNQMNTYSPS